MQWVVGHDKPEFCFVIINIGYQSTVDSLQQDVESTLELDLRELVLSYGSQWSLLELIYLDDIVYEA